MEEENNEEEIGEDSVLEQDSKELKGVEKSKIEKSGKREVRIDNNPDKRFDKIMHSAKKNPWIVSTIILGIIVIILLFSVMTNKGVTGNVISGEDAGVKIVDYLNQRTGGGVEYVSFEEMGGLYQINVNYEGQEIPVFSTKDGEYFVQGAVPITGEIIENDIQEQQPVEILKSDKPEVELFVMTHCPYGTQAEKGILPVFELLGDKIDANIKFVHYFMHDPEEAETPVQVCIREEQSGKYLDYLKCFLEDGNSGRCLSKTGIDQSKLNSCINTNADKYYQADSGLSEGYGVRGSPTLIINGQMAESGRSSSAYLSIICSAFNTAPDECSELLSSVSPGPGFGTTSSGGSGSDSAQC